MEKEKQPVTHAVTTPNRKPPTKLEILKLSMGSQEYMKQTINYFRGHREEAMAFLTSSVEYIRRVPKLLECDKTSVMQAFMTAAQFRFMPSGVMGEAYIIPYKSEAKFQLGYQGLVTLMWRTEKIKSLKTVVVYDNEQFEYSEGLETKLVHVPTPFGQKRGKPMGVYAIADTTNGGRIVKVMSESQVMAIKSMSKAKDCAESPWNSKDPEKWMWQKTCLIQLAKLLPKTQEIRKAIEEDYKGEGMDKPEFDAAGPAVGAALHQVDGNNETNNHEEEPDPFETIEN